ncbi:MAG: cytochrome, partial [Verrucomicrobiales bacterium]|nr:cytochrome [Verrucomicrobiales bacterium]
MMIVKTQRSFQACILSLCCLLYLINNTLTAAEPNTSPAFFNKSIRPLLNEYCLKCHSTAKQKGDLDLERFSSLDEVRKHPKVWQAVIEQVSIGEMPPNDKPQPKLDQRDQLLGWINAVLNEIAIARAGDPGPVVLRRLSNAEYTFTIRDLTAVPTLDPAREFPLDGAAGEGFMNVGNALVMSPSLVTKYLDAGKEIASHAVLLPDGFRFSAKSTRRDWIEEILADIRNLYATYTEKGGGSAVNLQGIKFDTRDGGVIPLEKYLQALLQERASGVAPDFSKNGLSQKYLEALRNTLTSPQPSILLGSIRKRWPTAKLSDAASIAVDISQWQRALWKFNSVGHIGKAGGAKNWLEPFNPISSEQEVRLKLPPASDAGDISIYLSAGDAGDGNENDFVVWKEPRFVAPGKPTLALSDLRNVMQELTSRRDRTLAATAKSLAAATEAQKLPGNPNVQELAQKYGVESDVLHAWFQYLGLVAESAIKIDSYFTNTLKNTSNLAFINGWGNPETPNLTANSSDQHVRIPGNMKPHSIAVHPSPKLQAVVGWRSPLSGTVNVQAVVQHAHPECGNGVAWSLELRHGSTRQRLDSGFAQGAKEVNLAPISNLQIRTGDFISLLINSRDGNHSCDLTAVDLIITEPGKNGREWNLASDVSPNVLAGNPHADRLGNEGIWHFYTEPDRPSGDTRAVVPANSLLAKWQLASEGKQQIAEALQTLLASPPPVDKNSPDAKLYQQLTALTGPLVSLQRNVKLKTDVAAGSRWGLDPAQFGNRSNGSAGDPTSLYVKAPSVLEIHLPAELVSGYEFAATGTLDAGQGAEGSVQLQVLTQKPSMQPGLASAAVRESEVPGMWSSNNRRISSDAPIIVRPGSATQKRVENDLEAFREMFPAALCYTKIVPVDEVVTLTLFYREDHHFSRLMLNEAEQAKLNRLWSELHYVSQDALTSVDVFEQLYQFATQDADPKVFEPMREPIRQNAAAFRLLLTNSQPAQINSVVDFAGRAYRRPLSDSERSELRTLYARLRQQELPHDEALRLTLARILVAPPFLYHAEKPGRGKKAVPVTDWELANRLSYFLWSSAPDSELNKLAAQGKLQDPDILAAQSRRMLRDPRVRRLATEFACAWLHIYGFDELGEKSERHFPTFTALRGAMYEESILFFTDLFQNNRSVLNILDADYTFLNEPLAKHYEIPGVTGLDWRRVDGVKKYSRGGILGQSTTLAKQSGASRTSPILRGNWV